MTSAGLRIQHFMVIFNGDVRFIHHSTKGFSFCYRWLPELQEMVQQLKDKLDNKIKPKKISIKNTGTTPEITKSVFK